MKQLGKQKILQQDSTKNSQTKGERSKKNFQIHFKCNSAFGVLQKLSMESVQRNLDPPLQYNAKRVYNNKQKEGSELT